MIVRRYNGILVPKNHLKYDDIKKDLNRTVQEWNGTFTKMKFYEDYEDGILIPRFYPIEPIQDMSIAGDNVDIQSTIVPRNTRQEQVIQYLISNKSGVMKLEPGSGKTVLSIDVICKIGKRAIVFVHKNSLRDQWKQEALTWTNLKEEDIGILKSATFKKDLKKPLIISTVQGFCSLLQNKHAREDLKSFQCAH